MFNKIAIAVWALLVGITLTSGFFLFGGFIFGYLASESSAKHSLSGVKEVYEMKAVDNMDVYEKINEYRVSKGLRPLRYNPIMCGFTKERLSEIHDNWSHDGYLEAIKHFRYVEFGENIERGHDTPEEVVGAWIKSPKHLEVLSTPAYTDTCIESDVAFGRDDGRKSTWMVQHFASF